MCRIAFSLCHGKPRPCRGISPCILITACFGTFQETERRHFTFNWTEASRFLLIIFQAADAGRKGVRREWWFYGGSHLGVTSSGSRKREGIQQSAAPYNPDDQRSRGQKGTERKTRTPRDFPCGHQRKSDRRTDDTSCQQRSDRPSRPEIHPDGGQELRVAQAHASFGKPANERDDPETAGGPGNGAGRSRPGDSQEGEDQSEGPGRQVE